MPIVFSSKARPRGCGALPVFMNDNRVFLDSPEIPKTATNLRVAGAWGKPSNRTDNEWNAPRELRSEYRRIGPRSPLLRGPRPFGRNRFRA